MADDMADAVEAELAELSRQLTEPRERECLRCFLLRMISEFGCDGTHRWTVRWRDLRARGARDLVQRVQRRGGCCCDCEVIFNVFPVYPDSDPSAHGAADPARSTPAQGRISSLSG